MTTTTEAEYGVIVIYGGRNRDRDGVGDVSWDVKSGPYRDCIYIITQKAAAVKGVRDKNSYIQNVYKCIFMQYLCMIIHSSPCPL